MRQSKRILDRVLIDKDYIPSISTSALAEVQREMEAYSALVMQSGLSTVSKGIYIDFADKFVRWLAGNFTPGEVKDGRGRTRRAK
jgi:hypothetical protein